MITTEISVTYKGYSSQLPRPFSVGKEPSETYPGLYTVAKDAYNGMIDALHPGNTVDDVYEAIAPIEESEFKIYDVLLHGHGGGYIHPFFGTKASNYWPGLEDPVTASWEFSKNMVIVVQPNVVTQDERQDIQFGTTVIVRGDGPETIHGFPEEFIQVYISVDA